MLLLQVEQLFIGDVSFDGPLPVSEVSQRSLLHDAITSVPKVRKRDNCFAGTALFCGPVLRVMRQSEFVGSRQSVDARKFL